MEVTIVTLCSLLIFSHYVDNTWYRINRWWPRHQVCGELGVNWIKFNWLKVLLYFQLSPAGTGLADLSNKDLPPSPVDDDFNALVSFRCQYCSFSSADVPSLMNHSKTEHAQVSLGSVITVLKNCWEVQSIQFYLSM